MKHIVVSIAASVTMFFGLALPAQDAEARRLGGGSSFGMQRSAPPPTRQATPPRQAQPQPANAAGGSRSWLGPVAGIAAGLGLAALASHLGFGEEMASFLLILLLVGGAFFLYRMLTRSARPQQGKLQYAGAGAPMSFDATKVGAGGTATEGTMGTVGTAGNIPADFDSEGFLRQAKLNFIRLQAANDRGDMDDLKTFATPEVFAEVQMQYEERGRTTQFTDVVQLDADLLEVVTENGQHIASVYFHGLLREEEGAEALPFAEVWHLAKPEDGNFGWRVAGIQQAS